MNDEDYDIFHGEKFIESMRSSGYKDTAYAVAELVDNSIDAGARHVEILCQDSFVSATGRYSIDKIAVLDDGHGMNHEELRKSLLFGKGTDDGKHKIGKYGMGLPNSSLSQCKRVDVYSWKESKESYHSYIDFDHIKKGDKIIPAAEITAIPKVWKEAAKHLSKESGTLIVWSKLDRCSWTTSKKIMEHSEFLIGRMYRRFLFKKIISIDMIVFKVNNDERITEEPESRSMKPNDPMYLMAPSSTPGKWGEIPMFKPDVTPEKSYIIDYDGQKHKIVVRYSLEKDELRDKDDVEADQGNTKHGQHARKNTGISIMRSDREITLDSSLVPASDTRARWWGIEMDIPITLDFVVGLTNNKQQVNALSFAMRTVSQFHSDYSDQLKMEEEISQHDTTNQILAMVKDIASNMRSMHKRIMATRKGIHKSGRENERSMEIKIERGIKRENEKGTITQTDRDRENMGDVERVSVITDKLVYEGVEKEVADKQARQWVKEDKKIIFDIAEVDGSNFFTVENIGGILRIRINSNHGIYRNLFSLVEPDEYKDLTDAERVGLTHDGLWLLLASWARFEDLIEHAERRREVQDIRYDWGKAINTYLEQNQV